MGRPRLERGAFHGKAGRMWRNPLRLNLTAALLSVILAGTAISPAGAQDLASIRDRITGGTIRVPGDMPGIAEALEAVEPGGMVLVAPGVYNETLVLGEKAVTLASEYVVDGDEALIERTVLEGSGDGLPEGRMAQVILVEQGATPATQLVGFTIRGGDDGISCEGNIHILHNRFFGNVDAIDYEGGGGVCAYNHFEANEDDGIDLDGPCDGVFEHNVIVNNEDDGIEIRLHPYSGPLRRAIIRGNLIQGNGEDGIQFIDYPEPSNREFVIERNVIADSAMAGIGCMSGTNTRENYEAADIDEYVLVINNTLSGNYYGITGGNCFIVLNNIIVNTEEAALKNVDYNSVVSHILFWGNGRDNAGSNLTGVGVVHADPRLDERFRLAPGSPCIDAGIARFQREDTRGYASEAGAYAGKAPDLGAFEAGQR